LRGGAWGQVHNKQTRSNPLMMRTKDKRNGRSGNFTTSGPGAARLPSTAFLLKPYNYLDNINYTNQDILLDLLLVEDSANVS